MTAGALAEVETTAVVGDRHEAADGVVVLTLRGDLPPWEPGAHVDLVTPEGPRQYSLCGDPADEGVWRIGVLREPDGRGGSAFVHDELLPGATVRVRGPRNHFPLLPSPSYLFIAGGIGITPLLPMIDAAGADWRLVYGGRTRTSMAFLDALQPDPRVTVAPQDETGLLDLDALLGEPRADTLVYCCGPEPLLAAVEERCASWPAGSLRVERFAPKPVAGASTSFEVELTQSGVTLTVPADRSILDVVEEAGVTVLSSCSEGTCGTCETAVLDGEIDHRDSVLTTDEQSEGDCMMICVSRASCARLVLDL
ncbi:PDR/VanB family oxidoreductase [Pseudonocardia sp.]|uniref:PDR/VanB family oxidoreductase n=1 Tax=Pseudonocardia sp. TaxID=60912 RepID=UPI00262A058F|nr:PDR/VanB family oxidoreductase [Pseudonocardia sp.]